MIESEAKSGHSILELCELLEVSTSGYYDWATREPSRRKKSDAELRCKIIEIHKSSRHTYGSPRIRQVLEKEGTRCGKKRVARLMKENNIKGAQKARFRPKTTDSRHDEPISPNRLELVEFINELDRIWASDITYIPTEEGWLYLAAFMDMKSRKIKGWHVSESLETDLVEKAFRQAIFRYQPKPGLMIHSDRGCQYASRQFRGLLSEYKAIGSMSGKGNCYDNAAMESFWATLKTDMGIVKPFKTKEEARLALFDYIEVFYNRIRIHSALGGLSPLDYELQLCA